MRHYEGKTKEELLKIIEQLEEKIDFLSSHLSPPSQERFRDKYSTRILDALPDMLTVFDHDANIIELASSPATNHVEGINASNITTTNVKDILPEEAYESVRKNMDKVILTGESSTARHDLMLDGVLHHYENRIFPLDNKYLLCMCRDISQQWEAEQTNAQQQKELKAARVKAEESDRLKSAFLANMSHEIRTPLNAIVGFSEIIALTEDEVEKAEYLNIIQKNSNLLLQLINDILDLSRIESGKSEMNFQLVEMTGLIDEVEKVHRLKMKTAIRLNVIRPDEEIWIMVDRNRITQVLFNFLSNAIKNTHEGAITLGLEVCGEWLKVYVTDTGCGIAKEKLPLIFNRFEKLNDFVQGTGLGLPICQSIVERLGGKISVESEVGVGSTFVMTLPYRQFVLGADGEPVEINAHVERRSDGRKKILIAEDTESNFMQINILLKKDYTISWVTNGEEAVNSFLRERPDLILMDIRMPVMNGIQATEKIRTVDIDLPIVAVTANAFLIEQQQALAAGCNDIIAKPYTYERLKETIIKYI